jgi:hypothetical protein
MCEKVPNSDLDFSTFGQIFGIISQKLMNSPYYFGPPVLIDPV